MSTDGKKEPPPYIVPGELEHTHTHTHHQMKFILGLLTASCFFLPSTFLPVEGRGDGVKVYHVHTPFTPPTSNENTASQNTPGKLTPDFRYTLWNHVLGNLHAPSWVFPLSSPFWLHQCTRAEAAISIQVPTPEMAKRST